MAGQDLDACVTVLRRLNEKGFKTNTTLLGEDVLDEAAARAVADEYVVILDRLHAEELRCNVALKLTHLGLDIDEELAYENLERVVAHAATLGNFIRIDMEYSALVDPTLRLYRRLREAGHANVGTVLQSYLYRTPDDLESLLSLEPNLRLVKGAYLEPESVAYPSKSDVDAAYLRLVERSLTGGGYTAIATHDERMIEARPRLRRAGGNRPRPLRAADALRRPPAAPARPARPRLQGARGDPVRPGVVPVLHAAAGRAAREPALRRPEPGPGARPPERRACRRGRACASRRRRARRARSGSSRR